MQSTANKRLEMGFVFGLLGAGLLGVVGAIIGGSTGETGVAVAFGAAGIGLGAGAGGLIGAASLPPSIDDDEA